MTEQFRPAMWSYAVVACALLLLLAVLPPFVGPGFRHALMRGFDLTCHQIPERSFQIGGIPIALCQRCTGVVVGLVVGSLAVAALRDSDRPFIRNARLFLVLSLLPMIIDWSLDAFGIWANVPFSRVATGLVFGCVAGYTFARALAVRPPADSRLQSVPSGLPGPSHPTPASHA